MMSQDRQNRWIPSRDGHILIKMFVEKKMTQKTRKLAMNSMNMQFPPEADGEFAVVDVKDISAWRQKLNERFGIGSGKLRVVDDPSTA